MRKVVVTGIGVICPVGGNPDEFFANLLAGKSGIRRLSIEFASRLAVRIGGEVAFDPAAHFAKPKLALLDRFSQFALVAAGQAMRDAAIDDDDAGTERAGVYLGTGLGGARTMEAGYADIFRDAKDRVPPFTVVRGMNNAAAAHLSIDYKLRGPNLTYSTACSSSAVAIGEACRAIRHGYADLAIAGGAEAMLTLGMMRAWEALRTLAAEDAEDPAASCRPFSLDRSGLVLGEGAGVVVLETAERARARGAKAYAELAGYGSASDAEHLTRPSRAGEATAMRLALADARLDARDIGYVNAHGTATLAGDRIEVAAIKDVFGEHAKLIPVSSTKSMHGHLMGATGAVEFIASVLALHHGALPPTANLRVPDPECDLDFVPHTGRRGVELGAVMSNSFAFGGSNAVLIASKLQ